MQIGCPSQQGHCADKARQAKNVVAVIMGNEDVSYARHRQTHLLHLNLCPFSTIYHVVFASDIYYL